MVTFHAPPVEYIPRGMNIGANVGNGVVPPPAKIEIAEPEPSLILTAPAPVVPGIISIEAK